MRRLGIIVGFGALLGLFAGVVSAVSALAAGRGDGWDMADVGPITVPADACGFAIDVNPVAKAFTKELKSSDDSAVFLSTGSFKASYTNVDTGKSITENLSGPGTVTVLPDGSLVVRTQGLTGLFLDPADAMRFDLPTVAVTAGPLTETVDPDGNITSLSLTGHVQVDVCAALS